MSKKSEQVEMDSLINRWIGTSAPAVGATCVAQSGTSAPETLGGRVYCDGLLWSVNNGKGAAAATFTGSYRDASIGGAVLESFDVVVAAGGSAADAYYTVVPGLVGNQVFFEFGTPNASAQQKATIVGWQEDFR